MQKSIQMANFKAILKPYLWVPFEYQPIFHCSLFYHGTIIQTYYNTSYYSSMVSLNFLLTPK